MDFDLVLRDIPSLLCLIIGTFFMMVAGVGIIRMPDLFLRMSMTTKAATLGVGSMLIACIFYFNSLAVSAQSLAIVVFLLLTAPVSANMIGRAGYRDRDVCLWKGTHTDDLQGYYTKES